MDLPVITVVGAFLKKGDKFLILQRHPDRPQPLTWALPSGKVDKGEVPAIAIRREIFEETGVNTDEFNIEFAYSKIYDFSKDGYNTHYHVYTVEVPENTETVIEQGKHIEHRWVTAEECLAMEDLIDGFDDVIRRTFNMQELNESNNELRN